MSSVIAGNVRFTVIDPMCVRMEYSPEGRYRDLPTLFAANRDLRSEEFTAWTDKVFHLKTAHLEIEYRADQRCPAAGTLTVGFPGGRWKYGMRNEGDLGGVLQSLDDCEKPVPLPQGFLSRDGWQVIDDSRASVLKDGWIAADPREETYFDLYFFSYGRRYKEALKLLMALSGKVPMLPRWCMGSWYSRWFRYSSDDYRSIVREYRENGIPLDVMVMDMEWHTRGGDRGWGWGGTIGWTGWSWNRELLPDAEKLLAELRADGVQVAMNVHPHDGIRSHETCYRAFMEAMGESAENGNALPFDASSPKYMENYFEFAHGPLEKAGCGLWWVDWQQDCICPSLPGIPGQKHVPWLNACYFRHSRREGRRGIAFSRWGGFGDQKHPIHFSGDTSANWSVLRFQIAFTALSGNSGCFFWTHDMGGFCGTRQPELYARWLQFGALSAAMRLHSAGDDLDRRPWRWEEPFFTSLKESFRLRSRLMPYLYTAIHNACRDSVPMLRPLYLEYPDREEAYGNMQEFFCGDDLLAAPVTAPGCGPGYLAFQKLFIPEGEFCNFFTGVRYAAGTYPVPADLFQLPLFVRSGVPLVLGDPRKKHLADPDTAFEVQFFPASRKDPRTFTLYEDDGVSDGWEKGRFAETRITATGTPSGVVFDIEPSTGTFDGIAEERRFTFRIRNAAAAEQAVLNGRPVGFRMDDGTVLIGPFALKRAEALRLEVRFTEESDSVLAERAAKHYLAESPGPENEALLAGTGVLAVPDPLTDRKSLLVFPEGLAATEISGLRAKVEETGPGPITLSMPEGRAVFRYRNGAVFEFGGEKGAPRENGVPERP